MLPLSSLNTTALASAPSKCGSQNTSSRSPAIFFVDSAGCDKRWSTDDGVITIEVDKLPVLGLLYTVRISSRPTIAWPGTHGHDKFFTIPKDEANDIMTYIFQVRIDTQTSKWRSGSPALPGYKEWSDQMTEILRNSFGELRLYDRVKTDGCVATDDTAK